MKRLVKLKKGFTLVELIIVMGVMGILVVAAMALFGPVSRMVNNIESDVYANNISDTVISYVTDSLSKCTTYNIDAFSALDGDKGTTGTVAYKIDKMIADSAADTSDTHCLIISKNADGNHVLYDLGIIASAEQYQLRASASQLEKYRVFGDDFYNGYDYVFEFDTFNDTSSDGKWCKISLVAFTENSDGTREAVVEERSSMFKLLNMTLNKISPTSNSILRDFNADAYPADDSIVILYRTKDYTNV